MNSLDLEFQAWNALSDEALENFEQELIFQGDWTVDLGTEDIENAAGVLQPWQQLPPSSWS